MCLYEGISENFQYSTSFWPEKGSPWLWLFHKITCCSSVCKMTFCHVTWQTSSSVASVLPGNTSESAVFMTFLCSWIEETLSCRSDLPQNSPASTWWSWLGHLLTHIVFNAITVTFLLFLKKYFDKVFHAAAVNFSFLIQNLDCAEISLDFCLPC